MPPSIFLAHGVNHPWVVGGGTGGGTAAGKPIPVMNGTLRHWDPGTDTLGAVVVEILRELAAPSGKSASGFATLAEVDVGAVTTVAAASHDVVQAAVRAARAARQDDEGPHGDLAEEEWVPEELLDVAAAFNDVAELLLQSTTGTGTGTGEGEHQRSHIIAHSIRAPHGARPPPPPPASVAAAASLAATSALPQPAGWSDEGEGDGDEGSSDDDDVAPPSTTVTAAPQQPPHVPPVPPPVPRQRSVREGLIAPPPPAVTSSAAAVSPQRPAAPRLSATSSIGSPGSPGSVAALAAMLATSPPPLASQHVHVLPTAVTAAHYDDDGVSTLASPPPRQQQQLMAPVRTTFLVPRQRRRGSRDGATNASSSRRLAETSDDDGGGGGDGDVSTAGWPSGPLGGVIHATAELVPEEPQSSADEAHARDEKPPRGGSSTIATDLARWVKTATAAITAAIPDSTKSAAAHAAVRFAEAMTHCMSAIRTKRSRRIAAIAFTSLLICAAYAHGARVASDGMLSTGLAACFAIRGALHASATAPALSKLGFAALIDAAAQGNATAARSLYRLATVRVSSDAGRGVAGVRASPLGMAACLGWHEHIAHAHAANVLPPAALCGTRTPALVVSAARRRWAHVFLPRVVASFSGNGAVVLGLYSTLIDAADTHTHPPAAHFALLASLAVQSDPDCAVATASAGYMPMAGATAIGLAARLSSVATPPLLARGIDAGRLIRAASAPLLVSPTGATRRALAIAAWTGPMRGTLLCRQSAAHAVATAHTQQQQQNKGNGTAASGNAVATILRPLLGRRWSEYGLRRGYRCGPLGAVMYYKQSPLHAALQQRNMAAVEAILGAAASLDDDGAIMRVLRDGARVGCAFGLSLKTSSPLAAAVESHGAKPGGAASPPPRGAAGAAKKVREQASAADMVALLMSTVPGGGAPSALLTAGVTYGPFGGSLVAISPLGLAFAQGDVASAAALLRAGHPHDDATSCGSIMLYGALSPLPVPRLMRCSRLAASGRGGSTVGAAALLAAWKEHVAMEAADRVAVLLAANRGDDEQHTSQRNPSEGEQQPAPEMPNKEAQLLAAEADAAAEADLRLRVAASLAKARDTLASVSDSTGAPNSGAAAHLDADVSASSVAALEAAASALAAARRQAERTAAEVRAAAARVAADTAAEEAASRRAAAQQAAATARMQRQQARDRAARAEGRAVEAEEEEGSDGSGIVFDGTEPWMTATDESGGDAALNALYDVGTDEL